jgi:DNA polymerase III subunit chi
LSPRVDFHILKKNLEDAYFYLARLVEKAFLLNSTIAIFTQNEKETFFIDNLLWTFSEESFIPHEVWDPDENSGVPVIISHEIMLIKRDVLINLTDSVPTNFSSFPRIIELVYTDEAVASKGREKYREYKKTCEVNTFQIN